MFLKLLLTALVIAGALITLRLRNQRALQQSASAPRLIQADPVKQQGKRRLFQFLAGGALVLMLLGATMYLYHQWRDTYQEVAVKVIDTRSGQVTSYRAYKGDIKGRTFVTTEGVTVSLAEVERLEIGAEE